MRDLQGQQALVAANHELISRFERKIQSTLARIWREAPEEDGLAQSREGAKEEGKECRDSKLCVSEVLHETPSLKLPSAMIRKSTEDAVSESGLCASAPLREKILSPESEPEPADSSILTRPVEMDKSDFTSLFCDVLTVHGPCDRETVIKQAATSLGNAIRAPPSDAKCS